jgi:hypothetical protein
MQTFKELRQFYLKKKAVEVTENFLIPTKVLNLKIPHYRSDTVPVANEP